MSGCAFRCKCGFVSNGRCVTFPFERTVSFVSAVAQRYVAAGINWIYQEIIVPGENRSHIGHKAVAHNDVISINRTTIRSLDKILFALRFAFFSFWGASSDSVEFKTQTELKKCKIAKTSHVLFWSFSAQVCFSTLLILTMLPGG